MITMPLLEIANVHKTFRSSRRGGQDVHAVKGVSLSVDAGETVGVIGESGSGKSTLGRLALSLLKPDSGSIHFDGFDLGSLDGRELRSLRSSMQVVFQEPYQSLNPRLNVGAIVGEPLIIHRPDIGSEERRQRVREVLNRVGLPDGVELRLPAELSGGQQQRVGIARAIVCRPKFVVLDEPTSSLDLSIRAQILRLLSELQSEFKLAYLFVSHDMYTVEWVSQRVVVMLRGEVVECGPTAEVFRNPQHPYSKKLLGARLSIDPRDRVRQPSS